jgi:hypothetical protein
MFKNLYAKILASIFLFLSMISMAAVFSMPLFNKFAEALNATDYVGKTQLTANDWARLPADFVAKSGDTITGPLILSGDPTQNFQAATKQYVDNGNTKDTSGNKLKIVCGQAPPTWVDNTGYPNSVYIDIDTRIGGVPAFTTTPTYFTNIQCTTACWRSMGANAIYNNSVSGFRVYIQNDGDPLVLTAASAIARSWVISWCAIGR